MRVSALVCVFLGLALCAGQAHAQAADTNAWDGGYKQTATRRSGFMLGVSAGLATGNAVGYPNELAKINDPTYERDTDVAVGSTSRIWFGGALTDWFVFGVGFAGVTLKHDDITASGGAFIFHVEGYPLFSQGGAFRDLSLFGDFGAGSLKLKGGDKEDGDGGLMSVIGLGVGYDPVHFWHFTFGPAVEYVQMWSQSASLHSAQVSARFTFVGGP